jgi:dihydroorotate dehydrogenase, subfamily 2
MLYTRFLKRIIFSISPNLARDRLMHLLRIVRNLPFSGRIIRMVYRYSSNNLKRNVFGIDFKNPVGLAPGMDPDAEFFKEMSLFGFSFQEIGSLTPLPQDPDRKTTMFSLPQDNALINRIGVRNKGVRNAIQNLRKKNAKTILIGSIARNEKSHDSEEIKNDFVESFSLIYDFVDMVSINMTYSTTDDEDELKYTSILTKILDPLLDLRITYDTYKPILVKISPDISNKDLDELLKLCMLSGVDGIIACNATKTRPAMKTGKDVIEKIGEGFLSGEPLFRLSLAKVKHINEFCKGRLPIIGVGGIMTPQQAKEMLDAGASLVEVMTGLIYEGPHLVRRILKHLDQQK